MKISYAGCLGLSPVILAQFTLDVCEKFTETFYFCGSRSFKVVHVGTHGKLIGSVCCTGLSATVLMLDDFIVVKWRFLQGYPFWRSCLRGISSPWGTKFGHKKLETALYYGENPESLSYQKLVWLWVLTNTRTDKQTDRRTDRITIAIVHA